MTPTTATRVAHARVAAVLPAEDLERARTFYHDTLGFEIEESPGAGAFFARAGAGTGFMVYERKRTVAEHTVASFVVDDLEATMAEMRERGVTFEEYDQPGLKTESGIATMDEERTAWFTDPEGNIIAVSQMT